MTKDNGLNQGIICNVKNCVFNEKGCNCNLERVTISRGESEHHYCKSFISKDIDESDNHNNFGNSNINVESSNEITNDDFFNYDI